MKIINPSYYNHTPACCHNRLINILLEPNVASKFISAQNRVPVFSLSTHTHTRARARAIYIYIYIYIKFRYICNDLTDLHWQNWKENHFRRKIHVRSYL